MGLDVVAGTIGGEGAELTGISSSSWVVMQGLVVVFATVDSLKPDSRNQTTQDSRGIRAVFTHPHTHSILYFRISFAICNGSFSLDAAAAADASRR